jgi:hypothetical protein
MKNLLLEVENLQKEKTFPGLLPWPCFSFELLASQQGKRTELAEFSGLFGQTVMARFEPQDQLVNVRFAGGELRLPHVISGSGRAIATARQFSGTKAGACSWKTACWKGSRRVNPVLFKLQRYKFNIEPRIPVRIYTYK